MMVKLGTFITNRLRERGKTASDIARTLKIGTNYIFAIIHGQNGSWSPSALKIRKYIAKELNTVPEQLWGEPKKIRKYRRRKILRHPKGHVK